MIDQFSINFLIVLPELLQLVLINALLVFALCFSYVNTSHAPAIPQVRQNKANLIIKRILKDEIHKYAAYNIYPTLQTEPVIQLMVLGLICSALVYINSSLNYAIGFETVIWDHLSRFMSVLLCLSAAAALSLGIQAFKRFSRYEFVIIIWLSILGMLCLIKSYNFLAFYLSIELQSLSFYMLAAMRSRTEASAEAGLKYFILSAFSSAILLLGISLIYGAIGSQTFADLSIAITHFNAISDLGQTDYVVPICLYVGLGCICVSLLFKLGAAPFHSWIADVYEGSHTPITAFFAITSKIGVATVLIRILSNVPDNLINLLTAAAVISLLVGSLSAMRQVKLKRLLAFSGVANVGWFLLALVAGQWQLLIIHLMVYILLSITLFSVFVTPLFRTHPNLSYRQRVSKSSAIDQGADNLTLKYISDLHQIYKINPSLAFAVTIAMFSLAGIPPLAGFYSKYLIINAITQNEHYGVLAFALGAAVISAFYYIRVIKTVYFSTTSTNTQGWFTVNEISVNATMISCTTVLTFLFFMKPDYFCIWLATV